MRRLSAVAPLNFDRVQNLMAVSPSGKPSVVMAETRMHQQATHGVQRQQAISVALVWRVSQRADRLGLRPFI